MSQAAAYDRVHPLRWRRGRPQPFPTIFWLRAPELLRAVSDFERLGGIARWEQRLAEDPDLREAVHGDHARYAALRARMLTPDDRQAIRRFGLTDAFAGTGIAGIRLGGHSSQGQPGLKCLHAHVAHALADANAVGAGVLAELGVAGRR